jgi:uncharacterized membrane-anchored protein
MIAAMVGEQVLLKDSEALNALYSELKKQKGIERGGKVSTAALEKMAEQKYDREGYVTMSDADKYQRWGFPIESYVSLEEGNQRGLQNAPYVIEFEWVDSIGPLHAAKIIVSRLKKLGTVPDTVDLVDC